MLTIRRLSILLTLTMLMLILTSAAHALTLTSSSGFAFSCHDFTGTVNFTYDRDNTGFGSEQIRERVVDGDGTQIYLGGIVSGPLGANHSIFGTGIYAVLPDHNPLRYELFSLAGNGLPEVVVHTETGSCAGLPDVPVPPVFTDGRINPQTYAPVVLYCQQSTLSAWTGDGYLLFNVDIGAVESPAANSVLHSQAGIDVYVLADGGFSVVAPQSDGKLYQFVFAGCPDIGETAVYVSDPVTGEFIRAQ